MCADENIGFVAALDHVTTRTGEQQVFQNICKFFIYFDKVKNIYLSVIHVIYICVLMNTVQHNLPSTLHHYLLRPNFFFMALNFVVKDCDTVWL